VSTTEIDPDQNDGGRGGSGNEGIAQCEDATPSAGEAQTVGSKVRLQGQSRRWR
jgi:hypothetical protein